MQIADLCRDSVTVIGRDTPIHEAALLMRRYHIGDVVVVDTVDGKRIPSGIVTDRDIVVGVVAMGLDPRELTAGDIMGDDLITVPETYDVHEALTRMREEGVRRMPVVNTRGELTGIVAFDDLLPLIAEELAALALLPSTGRHRECALRH